MSVDAQIARSFFPDLTERAPRQPSSAIVRPMGTIATLSQMVEGLERNRLSVLLTSRMNDCVCLRSPIGLAAGVNYRLQIGTRGEQSIFLRITSSRQREDGSYDVGAREVAEPARYAAAA